jgi:hypothetical protein
MKTAILLLTAATAFAHRLDEYLQATLVSVEQNRVQGQITLTPGVAVYPIVLAAIGSNQRAYAERVLQDMSMNINGRPLIPHLVSSQFPTIDDMKEGRGEIHIEFAANVPFGGSKLTIENHHLSRIAAYQVNSLVPHDPNIRIVKQNRNYDQSHYELEYVQSGVVANGLLAGAFALLLFTRLAWRWTCGARTRACRVETHLDARAQ